MSLTVNDLDDAFLAAKSRFSQWLVDFQRTTFQPVALMALAQQIRQLPQPVQDQLRKQAPDAWQRLFGGVK